MFGKYEDLKNFKISCSDDLFLFFLPNYFMTTTLVALFLFCVETTTTTTHLNFSKFVFFQLFIKKNKKTIEKKSFINSLLR